MRTEVPQYTHNERKMIAALERRVERLDHALADWQGRDDSRARAERQALLWALDIVRACRCRDAA